MLLSAGPIESWSLPPLRLGFEACVSSGSEIPAPVVTGRNPPSRRTKAGCRWRRRDRITMRRVTALELWLESLGRLHPVVLHFPLALTVSAASVEICLCLRRRSRVSRSAVTMLWIAAITAPIAALSGWMNARFDASPSETLEWHRWSGLAGAAGIVAMALVMTAVARRANPSTVGTAASRAALLAVAACIGFCAHLGGEMKWGRGYTTELLPSAIGRALGLGAPEIPAGVSAPGNGSAAEVLARSRSAPPSSGAGALGNMDAALPQEIRFDEHVLPLFTRHCSECHLGGKHKGRLSLAERSLILRRNDDGFWIVRQGSAAESELMRRLLLPEVDPDAMPPTGPLAEHEIAVIQRWIEQGAP